MPVEDVSPARNGPASGRAPPADALALCEQMVREGDRERYFATLFAPADKRPYLYALYAFNLEAARVRESVSAALPGEIRLQWWRDALQGEARGEVDANPVMAALEATIVRFRLPRSALVGLLDARVFDLYDDPMPSVTALEGYCGETASILLRLASLVLADGEDPGGADAVGHAGVAYAMTGLMRAFPWHVRRGQLYVPPADVLEHHGLTREQVVAGTGGAALRAALAQMRTLARDHKSRALAAARDQPSAVRSLLVGLGPVEIQLREMERRSYDPYATIIEPPLWRTLLALWRLSRRLS